eukprot:scaffold1038_cov122-Isochrysis_galbana.AAC.10
MPVVLGIKVLDAARELFGRRVIGEPPGLALHGLDRELMQSSIRLARWSVEIVDEGPKNRSTVCHGQIRLDAVLDGIKEVLAPPAIDQALGLRFQRLV